MIRQMFPALAVAVIGFAHGTADAAALDTKTMDSSSGLTASDILDVDAETHEELEGFDQTAHKKGGKRAGSSGKKRASNNNRNSSRSSSRNSSRSNANANARHESPTRSNAGNNASRSGSPNRSGSSHASPNRSGSSHASPNRSGSPTRSGSSHTSPSRSHASPSRSANHKQAHSNHARARHTSTRSGNQKAAHSSHHSRASNHTRSKHASRSHAARHSRAATSRHRKTRAGKHRVVRVRSLPPRWVPVYHRYHVRGVPRYHPRYWGAGVFYYNPPPRGHNVVVVSGNGANGKRTRHSTKPTRAINRNNSFSVGINGGTYASGYETGGGYSDLGLGLTAQWRPVEAVGLEFGWSHTSHSWDEGSERINSPTQASVNVYAFPWTRVSPYATLGLTWNTRSINDTYWDGRVYQTALVDDTLFGPHVGLGMEFALGDKAALDFEGKYISYLDKDPEDLSVPAAVQGTMGLNFYF